MPRFSANIGFLWPELDLPDRIRAAGRAGFDAVECHFPYDYEPGDIAMALAESGTVMVGLNTSLGANGQADFGVAARPGREDEARRLIDQAIGYAAAIDCRHVNVTAGLTGGIAEAETVFRQNLAYASEQADHHGVRIVIEPLSPRAAPGAHVSRVEDALATVTAVGAPNLGVMLDCYHTQITQGDLTARLRLAASLGRLGHVQIAAVPDRGEPDAGEVAYEHLYRELDAMGYQGWIGAEYHPRTTTDDGLGWFAPYRGETDA